MKIRTTVEVSFTTPDITNDLRPGQLRAMEEWMRMDVERFMGPLLRGARDVSLRVRCTEVAA